LCFSTEIIPTTTSQYKSYSGFDAASVTTNRYESLPLEFFYDFPSTGEILAKIYVQFTNLSSFEAAKACEAHYMRLYQISTPVAQTLLHENLKKKFGVENRKMLWVNGLVAPACKTATNSDESFALKYSACENKLWSICESIQD
jgi:hypothetical protein